jgi:hypothetical protein
MERLTARSENGVGIYVEPSREPSKWEQNRHGVLQKLADYEDTGLLPEEIKSLQAELDQWKREAISSTAKLGEIRILAGMEGGAK